MSISIFMEYISFPLLILSSSYLLNPYFLLQVNVLADMELWGVGVDMEACLRARHVLMGKLKELEKDAHNLAGMPFSLYSAADIAHVLYSRLKLPIPNNRKKGKLHPSTNKQSLDLLRFSSSLFSSSLLATELARDFCFHNSFLRNNFCPDCFPLEYL